MAAATELVESETWPNIRSMQAQLTQSNVLHPIACWVVATLLGQAIGAGAAPIDDLATLFYTPLQRQAISAGRQPTLKPGDMADLATSTQLNGIVLRAGGNGTVWLNHKPVPEGTSPAGKIQALGAMVDGRHMRVGESVDRLTGARTDVVEPGAVRVQNKP